MRLAVIGYTNSEIYPTQNPFQENHSLLDDSFLCVFKIRESIDGETERSDYTLYVAKTVDALLILVIAIFLFRRKKQL